MTRAALYAVTGAALSVGAPAGLLVVRASTLPSPAVAALREDVVREAATYAYVSLSTFLAFAIFGHRLGTKAAGRWGGDEFMVVAPSTALEAATALAERIGHAVRSAKGEPAVTVSIGVTETAGSPEPAASALDRADRALYAAKAAGRDRVVAFGRAS